MLQAILNRKLGRSIDSQEVHWSQLFRASEDSLTSTVFGNLLHLPEDIFWSVLKNACYGGGLNEVDENITHVEFWPHWNAKDSTNKYFVEPDVFIRTKDTDIIIEAKRHDDWQQNDGQWRNELNGYLAEYGSEGRAVILLALGGIHSSEPELIRSESGNECIVVKCRWQRILHQIKAIRSHHHMRGMKEYSPVQSICMDLINAFALHGYFTGDWFEDNQLQPYTELQDSSLETLEELGNQFKFMYQPYRLANYQVENNSLNQLDSWKP